MKTATKATATHLKKNVGSYGILLAILTSITPLVLEHFWPSGDETAREQVVQSHDTIANAINKNNQMISQEIDRLRERLDNERTRRQTLEDKVATLEDETRYMHGRVAIPSGNRSHSNHNDEAITVEMNAVAADNVAHDDDVDDSDAVKNKMLIVPELKKF